MSIRLNLSLLTIVAAFSATIPGCGDDADGDPDNGGEAGEASTGGKSTTGGRASTEAGSTGEAGETSTGGKSGTGGAPSTDAGAPSTDAGAPGEAGSTGTGGSSTGGASSTGGKSGGEGGAPAGECTVPQCLIDLVTGCEPEGECTQTTNLDPQNPPTDPNDITFAICWENGVKAGMQGLGGDTVTLEYQKDGDVCYMAEFPIQSSTTTEITFKDASGNVVATEVVDNESNTVTITCEDGGESVTYSPDDCGSEEPAGEQPDTSECAMTTTCALD
jgi:hypothetical protein